MTHKLASAIVCIGIAVGSLGAPKSANTGAKPDDSGSPTSQQSAVRFDGQEQSRGSVNAPLGAEASSLAFGGGTLQPGQPGTNSFGVTLQQ